MLGTSAGQRNRKVKVTISLVLMAVTFGLFQNFTRYAPPKIAPSQADLTGAHIASGSLTQEAQKAADLGIKNVTLRLIGRPKLPTDFFYKNPNYTDTDFGTPRSLKELVASPPFQRALAHSFSTVVLETQDFASYYWIKNRNSAATEFTPEIEREIQELVSYLYHTYGGSRTFIIKPAASDKLLSQGSSECATPEQVGQMLPWYQSYAHAMTSAKWDIWDGWSKYPIYFAIELSEVRLNRKGTECGSMLTSIIPNVASDFASFVAIESIHSVETNSLALQLLSDIEFVQSRLDRPLIIGAWSVDPHGAEATARMGAVLRAFQKSYISKAFFWELQGPRAGLVGSELEPYFTQYPIQ